MFLSVVEELVSRAGDVVLEMFEEVKTWLQLVLQVKVDLEFGIVEDLLLEKVEILWKVDHLGQSISPDETSDQQCG